MEGEIDSEAYRSLSRLDRIDHGKQEVTKLMTSLARVEEARTLILKMRDAGSTLSFKRDLEQRASESLDHDFEMRLKQAIDRDSGSSFQHFGYVTREETGTDDADQFLGYLCAISLTRTFKKGADILLCGAEDRQVFHLLSGVAQVVSSRGTVLSRIVPGEVFGEDTVMLNGNGGSKWTIIAGEECECLVVSLESLQFMVQYRAAFGARMYRTLALFSAIRVKRMTQSLRAPIR